MHEKEDETGVLDGNQLSVEKEELQFSDSGECLMLLSLSSNSSDNELSVELSVFFFFFFFFFF